MEQKRIRSGDRLPPLSVNHNPLLVAQILDGEGDTGDHIFYAPLSHYRYRCRIPELVGKRIRACSHGWVILSDRPHHAEWSLWNPVTSMLIRLPRLTLKDGDSDDIGHCCLSSPPYDSGSILLSTRYKKPNILFCRLDQRLKWAEISYAKQLRSLTGYDKSILLEPVCCNGKVYARATSANPSVCVVQVDIVVKEEEVVISLLPFLPFPDHHRPWVDETSPWYGCVNLKACSQELFMINVSYTKAKQPADVFLCKADMSSMVWVEMDDLKDDTMFLMDAGSDFSVNCSPAISSKSGAGGYIHFLGETGKAIYSFHVKDKTISMSCLDLPPRSGALRTSHISAWAIPEFRLQGDDGNKAKSEGKSDLLNIIPFDVLKMIMAEFCVGVEYLNFRATCKLCRLAAPVIQARKRLKTYSPVSPWLMVFDRDGGIITFTDPMFGDKYFIKAAACPELFYDSRILCSRYGWLLMFVGHRHVAFFNPFTGDIRELPQMPHPQPDSYSFSAPPTSPDCMVVGFLAADAVDVLYVYIHFVAREPASWRQMFLNLGGAASHPVGFPTFCGRDVYALFKGGRVDVFREIGDDMNFSWETVIEEAPRSSCCRGGSEYFQVKCDEHDFLLVMMVEFGESVEVWKLKEEEEEWEKMDDLGRHMIYICDETCVCMDAKTPEMENKIYFPRLHCGNGKVLFYSMETQRYHTFDGRDVGESFNDFFGTKRHVYAQAWIEPSWC